MTRRRRRRAFISLIRLNLFIIGGKLISGLYSTAKSVSGRNTAADYSLFDSTLLIFRGSS